tara:strand:+ start:3156 stop:3605 length:450 start_codon:yes stop_codon:yes gene_type:complete
MSKEWGVPTWMLLHTMSCKVNDNYFINNKKKILNIILLIFEGLPCPDCSTHAVGVFKKHVNSINTKEDLIHYLFLFHNSVNSKLKKKLYEKKNLEVYKEKKIKDILINWYDNYNPSKNIPKLMANNMHIKMIKKYIANYFKNDLKNYEL